MSAVELLRTLTDRGFRFEVRGPRLHVEPVPDPASVDELRAQKPALLTFIAEHGGVWPIPAASAHRYVLWRGAVDPTRSVCLSCGIPPQLHGDVALVDPVFVDDPNDAILITACAIVAAVAATGGHA